MFPFQCARGLKYSARDCAKRSARVSLRMKTSLVGAFSKQGKFMQKTLHCCCEAEDHCQCPPKQGFDTQLRPCERDAQTMPFKGDGEAQKLGVCGLIRHVSLAIRALRLDQDHVFCPSWVSLVEIRKKRGLYVLT